LFYWSLATIKFASGDLNNAQTCAEKALKFSQQNHEKWLEALSWAALGRILGKVDPLGIDWARDAILKGMKICDDSGYKLYSAQGHLFLGELHADTGQREKALENLRKAKAMYQEMKLDYWLGRTKEVMGRL